MQNIRQNAHAILLFIWFEVKYLYIYLTLIITESGLYIVYMW